MNRYAVACVGLSLLFSGTGDGAQSSHTKWVDPFIGTGSMDSLSLSGSNFPGPVLPFGLVQLSPDTAANPENPCSGYDYADDTIYGFSHTHLSGTGVADLFDFLFMPFKGDLRWAPSDSETENGYSSKFSHDKETAEPGYYRVFLDGPQMQVELTATEHCGIHRYSDKKGEPFSIMIDLDHSLDKERPYWVCRVIDAQVRVVDDHTIEGYRALTGWASERRVYFRAEFSRPFASTAVKAGHRIFDPALIGNHKNLKLIASFSGSKEPLTVNVGLSSVSYQGARDNLAAEISGFNFDSVRTAAKEKWDQELAVFDVEGTDKQKTLFYTSLYHLFIHPSNLADVNGDYLNCNGTLCNAPDQTHYSTFSLWDTYRAAHPLFTLTQEMRTAGFINSMLRQYTDYGYLPIWQLWGKETYCMIGNHAIPVIVDAYFKNIPGVDYELAYEAVKASSTTVHPGSPFNVMEQYKYLPEDIETQSVSIALEVAFNDWCAAQMAKAMGHEEDYAFFMERAGYYKNLFDPSIGFFRGKDHEGNWIEPFSPLKYGGNGGYPFTEGNAWQYLWYVPQDVYGLRDLFGGEKQFTAKLDEFFTLDAKPDDVNGNASGFIGQYAHGNEPSHHIAYLYNYTKTPWKAQAYVAKILDELYLDTPYGYSGNEDCGQMSAWYIFSMMGFYPVNPANGVYAFGSPGLQNAALHLANGKTFTVRSDNVSKDNRYIQSITLNGEPYRKTFITHQDIENGGELAFRMGPKPNKAMTNYDRPE